VSSAGFGGGSSSSRGHDPQEDEEPRIVVHDKRRLDPDTGAVREPSAGGPAAAAPDPSGSPFVPEADFRVAELTETLQRLKAEYDNYRRRAERERQALVEVATGNVLFALLPVLDDIERARAHGDLTGAFGSVGEALIGVTGKLGLESYAQRGEAFDPQVHEAVMQAAPADGVDAAVVADVFRPGYRHAGRVLRPAQVSVSEPSGSGSASGSDATGPSGPEEDEPTA
jgi:molecular chaperone GrpE